eukprot:scaffold236402_cov33-Tisochrysis_lutea.AAC.4
MVKSALGTHINCAQLSPPPLQGHPTSSQNSRFERGPAVNPGRGATSLFLAPPRLASPRLASLRLARAHSMSSNWPKFARTLRSMSFVD